MGKGNSQTETSLQYWKERCKDYDSVLKENKILKEEIAELRKIKNTHDFLMANLYNCYECAYKYYKHFLGYKWMWEKGIPRLEEAKHNPNCTCNECGELLSRNCHYWESALFHRLFNKNYIYSLNKNAENKV